MAFFIQRILAFGCILGLPKNTSVFSGKERDREAAAADAAALAVKLLGDKTGDEALAKSSEVYHPTSNSSCDSSMFSTPVLSKLLVESTRIRHLYVSRYGYTLFFWFLGIFLTNFCTFADRCIEAVAERGFCRFTEGSGASRQA
jgi:hypothetical protein